MFKLFVTEYKDILFNTARIFSSVFDIVLAYILAGSFFKPRLRRKHTDVIPFAVIAAAVIFVNENGIFPQYRYVIEGAALIITLFALYSDRLNRKTVGAMVFAVMLAVSAISSKFIFSLILKNVADTSALSDPLKQLITDNIANIILILTALFISALSKQLHKNSAPLILWTALLSVPAITLVIFSVFQYFTESASVNEKMLSYIYFSCLGLVFINVLVFVLFARLQKQLAIKRDTDLLRSQLSLQESSINRLETLYNRTRNFRHDIKNHILLLNVLAEQNDSDEIKKYLRELSGVIDESDYVRISGISVLDAILNEKMYEAQAQDITTSFDVADLQKNDIAPIDLCIILSNAIDNAIEANVKIEDKTKRFIKVKVRSAETYSVISVTNPVSDEPRKDAGGRFMTSKKNTESHGFGLKSIENTAEKYNGEMLAKSEDGLFTLVVRLNGKEQ